MNMPSTLQLHPGDDNTTSRLRRLAWALTDGTDWSRCDDHQVVWALAANAARDRSGAAAPKLYHLAPMAKAKAAPAAAAAPSPRRAAEPVAAVVDEAAFAADLDVAAMVAVLQQAAQTGVPFCEECAKAAAREAAAGSVA